MDKREAWATSLPGFHNEFITSCAGNTLQMMPPGYALIYNGSHFQWVAGPEEDLRKGDWIEESCQHWDRWACYRGAWQRYDGGIK